MTEERNPAEEAAQVRLDLGHYHPLMLITNEETKASWDLTCYACEQPIMDMSFYGCKQCLFFLHQSCRDLPPQLTHSYHPQHPLNLRPIPPSTTHVCDICGGRCNRFIYRCNPCDYDIDMKCALVMLSIQRSIQHKSHPHKLITLQKETMFSCDACGEEHKGTSYLCTTCGFWINQKCASSPPNLKLNNHHPHTLSLSYFVPQEDYSFRLKCKICSERIYRRYWVYCCSECRDYIHFHCAVSAKEHSINNETKTEELDSTNSMTPTSEFELSKVPTIKIKAHEPIIDLPMPDDSVDIFTNSVTTTSDIALSTVPSRKKKSQELDRTPINLPMLDDSVDIITQFIKNAGVQGKHKEAAKIEHRSHQHPLTYFEKPIDHTADLSSLLNGARNYEKCNGCAKSISPSAPFYHCVQCHFFLHVWCAELPADELYHPGHPKHTLSLITWEPRSKRCDCCRQGNTTLHYACEECYFILDCKCASLPGVINHEIDKHTLALKPISANSKCIACSGNEFSLAYSCGTCKLDLCISCALFPGTVRHRYDKLHPFILTYSPPQNYTKDDFCEICEEEIDPKRWFYHCGECNLYLHTGCFFHNNVYPSMTYGRVAEIPDHDHELTLVQPNDNLSCSLCGTNHHKHPLAILCPTCEFRLCYDCYRNAGGKKRR